MAPVARRRFDDDDDGDGPYDKRYPGRKVVADGGRVRVLVMLTDGMPDWASPRRAALYDARNHRPHFAEISDAANRRAVDAYEAHNRWLQDAWKQPSGQMQEPPDNSDPDGDDDDDLSPRDAYIRRLQGAYRAPIGSEADAIQNAFIRRISPGGAVPGAEAAAIEAARRGRRPGTAGVTFGAHDPAKFPSTDAASLKDARADRERAYGEYLDRISNGWRK